MLDLKVCEILDKAGDYIKDHFCKGTRHDGFGNVCAIGAIEKAAGFSDHVTFAENTPSTREALKLMAEIVVGEKRNDFTMSDACAIANFNNQPDTKAEDVAEKFHEAAVLCRKRLACNS